MNQHKKECKVLLDFQESIRNFNQKEKKEQLGGVDADAPLPPAFAAFELGDSFDSKEFEENLIPMD